MEGYEPNPEIQAVIKKLEEEHKRTEEERLLEEWKCFLFMLGVDR